MDRTPVPGEDGPFQGPLPAPALTRGHHSRSRSGSRVSFLRKSAENEAASRGISASPSHSDHFEDARSEPFPSMRSSGSLDDDDLDLLPPLETFFPLPTLQERASLCGSIENDLLPSTPLTEEQLRMVDSAIQEDLEGVTINRIEEEDDDGLADAYWSGYDIRGRMMNAAEQAEDFAIMMWHKLQSWKVVHFTGLPQWLQDNDFLHFGHRPPLPTSECFKSIVRIHTETGNIWTHLLGMIAFCGLSTYFLSRPLTEIQLMEKLVFLIFFAGAIVCLGLSFLYHTLCCHKEKRVNLLFAKFDYCGIAFLTMGSFVPWLYYSFYCSWKPQVIYLSIVVFLGIMAVIVSTFDSFAGPRFRPLRAGVFITFGLSGIAPATHYGVVNGWQKSLDEAALGWLILMGILYITGALLYALRIPERFFPGKVDIWFHSHQIFHCFVIAGAFVHYHGLSLMSLYRLKAGECPLDPIDKECLISTIMSHPQSHFVPIVVE